MLDRLECGCNDQYIGERGLSSRAQGQRNTKNFPNPCRLTRWNEFFQRYGFYGRFLPGLGWIRRSASLSHDFGDDSFG
jgi:hypothetical protein